jgi:hypothetical protein
MPEIPDGIVLRRHRDLEGRHKEIWVRRILLLLVAAVIVAGLFNVFGQRSSTSEVSAPEATLAIHTPAQLRMGLVFESRFKITASQEIKDAVLVLSRDWLEGTTLNTIEPSPVGEASENGRLSFDLGHIREGHTYSLYVQMQLNPTTFGRRRRETQLFDGQNLLLTVHDSVTIYP